MNELTRHMQDEVPWCMLFTEDIVLVAETKFEVNSKLKLWRETLESKGLKIRRNKTEYMECNFDKNQGIICSAQAGPEALHFHLRFASLIFQESMSIVPNWSSHILSS